MLSDDAIRIVNYSLLFIIIAILLLPPLIEWILGREKLVPKLDRLSPFTVKRHTPYELQLTATLPIANEGKQCGTIMDAILRVQLPYEQYDGIEAKGKVELKGAPREDDYFEAVLIEKDEELELELTITLKPRLELRLDEALANMVDLRMELIYQETGRTPCHYSKLMLTLKGDTIRKLAGEK